MENDMAEQGPGVKKVVNVARMDGLALEYEMNYGEARGLANLADFVDDPALLCPDGIYRPLLTEKPADDVAGDGGPVGNHR